MILRRSIIEMTSSWPGLTVSERRITMGEVETSFILIKFPGDAFYNMTARQRGDWWLYSYLSAGNGCSVWGPSSWNVWRWYCCRGKYFCLWSFKYLFYQYFHQNTFGHFKNCALLMRPKVLLMWCCWNSSSVSTKWQKVGLNEQEVTVAPTLIHIHIYI